MALPYNGDDVLQRLELESPGETEGHRGIYETAVLPDGIGRYLKVAEGTPSAMNCNATVLYICHHHTLQEICVVAVCIKTRQLPSVAPSPVLCRTRT